MLELCLSHLHSTIRQISSVILNVITAPKTLAPNHKLLLKFTTKLHRKHLHICVMLLYLLLAQNICEFWTWRVNVSEITSQNALLFLIYFTRIRSTSLISITTYHAGFTCALDELLLINYQRSTAVYGPLMGKFRMFWQIIHKFCLRKYTPRLYCVQSKANTQCFLSVTIVFEKGCKYAQANFVTVMYFRESVK